MHHAYIILFNEQSHCISRLRLKEIKRGHQVVNQVGKASRLVLFAADGRLHLGAGESNLLPFLTIGLNFLPPRLISNTNEAPLKGRPTGWINI